MSPLAPSAQPISSDIVESASSNETNAINDTILGSNPESTTTTTATTPTNAEKISYSSQELKELRYKNNELPKANVIPSLRSMERNSFMPAFARNMAPPSELSSVSQNKLRELYRSDGGSASSGGADSSINSRSDRSDNKQGRQHYRGRSSWHGHKTGEFVLY